MLCCIQLTSDVWLPDARWGSLPPCPSCESAEHVCLWSWQDKTVARRVVSETGHYFIMSRRYCCSACQSKHNTLKAAAQAVAQGFGLQCAPDKGVDSNKVDPTWTHMGYNGKSVTLLEYHRGLHFPAFLTHRGLHFRGGT